MPKGFVYILECCDGTYYTGSTIDINKRITEHAEGKGANHTKKRLPVKLVYLEAFQRIDEAFEREKQIQGWSRKKKEALIEQRYEDLIELSLAYRDVASRVTATSHSITSSIIKKTGTVPEALEGTFKKAYQSNGKLLLSGEYLVLDGAKSLALPTKYGQQLYIEPTENETICWTSYDENNTIWFKDEFSIDGILKGNFTSTNEVTERLIQILKSVHDLNPQLLKSQKGFKIKTTQDFNRAWGLGTSSTLINNIANWADINAYELLKRTFGGSGYDIACAQHDTAITYQLINRLPEVCEVNFNPHFKNQLYFVYLNQKQNSRDAIANYKKHKGQLASEIISINSITEQMIGCNNLSDFESLIDKHELIISEIICQKPVKAKFFTDFKGSIKSLGAWGGDFIMVTSKQDPRSYFNSKGYHTIIPYSHMIKS